MSQAVSQPPSPSLAAQADAWAGAAVAPVPSADAEVMIRVENLSKAFKLYRKPSDRLREWISLGAAKCHTDFHAVRAVSFDVRAGECVGIIGANGSGKSTLLKMLAGALHPTEGAFEVRGRTLSLIELGTGLQPLLTGRQNIINSSTLLGFPPGYARSRMAEIQEFAELGEFFDRPIRQYSTGMRVRLAFSMFACFRPDVFIVDEALSVGDVFFQQKCAARLRELLGAGMTMLFVSHDTSAVLNLCARVVLLEKGRPVFQGSPQEGVARYLASLRTSGAKGKWAAPGAPAKRAGPPARVPATAAAILRHDVIGDRALARHGAGGLRIIAVRVTDVAGHDTLRAALGDVLRFHLLVEAAAPVRSPRVGLRLFDRLGNRVFAAGTYQLGHQLPTMAPGDRVAVRLDLTMDVSPGMYTFGLGASEPDPEGEGVLAHDRMDQLGPIAVSLAPGAHRPFHGIARLPLAASHERIGDG
jgi:lipopolysaccharide transport system ATP-binding protein